MKSAPEQPGARLGRRSRSIAPRRGRGRGRGRGGFTLVEVLAALALLAIVLPVAMQGISLATSAASIARQRSEAAALADAKLSELIVTSDWQGGALSGDFAPDWPDYQWKAEVVDWMDPSTTNAGLEQLQVHVSWTSRGHQREVVVSTLVNPNAQQAGATQ